jgi:hypothetical protein
MRRKRLSGNTRQPLFFLLLPIRKSRQTHLFWIKFINKSPKTFKSGKVQPQKGILKFEVATKMVLIIRNIRLRLLPSE